MPDFGRTLPRFQSVLKKLRQSSQAAERPTENDEDANEREDENKTQNEMRKCQNENDSHLEMPQEAKAHETQNKKKGFLIL